MKEKRTETTFRAFMRAIDEKDTQSIKEILNISKNVQQTFPKNLDLDYYCRYLYLTGQDFPQDYYNFILDLKKVGNLKAYNIIHKYFNKKLKRRVA